MEEGYVLQSKTLLDLNELLHLNNDLKSKYDFLDPEWHEGKSLDENCWHYPIKSQNELSVQDVYIIKEKGLTLLLTKNQADKFENTLKLLKLEISNYPIGIIDSIPHLKGTGTGGAS